MAAHFAMGLAWLVVADEAGRIRSCESPTCRAVFVDFSKNRSRRYCDSRTCGNRLHVAAYRALAQAQAGSSWDRRQADGIASMHLLGSSCTPTRSACAVGPFLAWPNAGSQTVASKAFSR